MALFSTRNVVISGISACVPKNVVENEGDPVFGDEGAGSFMAATGVERRRIVPKGMCASDLCLRSAEVLLEELGWEKESVDCLVCVTQTPDYLTPSTAPMLQYKLGLPVNCYAMDINLGCSGWVYGLSVVNSLLSAGGMKRALMMVGDTLSLFCSKQDKSTYPLFGDAGTVTALEYSPDAEAMHFLMNSDGSGYQAIIMPDGAGRNPPTPASFELKERKKGIISHDLQIVMKGLDVFSFGITRAPQSVNELLAANELDKDSIDYFIFHQANLFMNEKIRKKLQLPVEKVPYSMRDYGNTSCATIPFTMVTNLNKQLESGKHTHVACGFGVGLSWASVYFTTDRIVCPDLIEL